MGKRGKGKFTTAHQTGRRGNGNKIQSPEQVVQQRFQRKEAPRFTSPEEKRNDKFETR